LGVPDIGVNSSRTSRFRACDLCEAICGLEFQFEGERMVAIRGDAADPFSRGHICPKGNAILDLESDPDRLRRRCAARPRLGRDRLGRSIRGGRRAAGGDPGARTAPTRSARIWATRTCTISGTSPTCRACCGLLKSRNVFSASSVDQWPHQLVARLMYGHQFLLPIPISTAPTTC
jgi:hypothetical protein